MQKLWVRITLSFLLLMFCVLLISGFYLAGSMKNTYMKLKEEQLHQTAQLALHALELNRPESNDGLQEKVRELSSGLTSRITIIDRKGNVLADSEEAPEEMENHQDRPEVKEVNERGKNSGMAVRYSNTLGYSMMYIAVPVKDGEQTAGAVRVALSLQSIEDTIDKLRLTLMIVLLGALLLTALIGIRIAKGIAKPVEEMIQVSNRLRDKDYGARVRMRSKGELGQLADAMNVLASSLKSQVETIHENEQQLSGVLRNMKSGVLLVDKEGTILLANHAFSGMLDVVPGELTGSPYQEVIKSPDLSILMNQCLKEQSELRSEIHLYHPDELVLDAHLAPYVGEMGGLKGIVAVLHDITEIRRLERVRSEFIANVSHELKTPVTSVKGFAETLLDGAMEDEEALRHFLGIIHKESERLHRLINDILHLSRIEQHSAPLEFQQLNLTEIAYNAADTIKKEVDAKNLQLILPQKQDVWAEGQKDRVQQMILNLMSNAIAYTPEGGTVTVNITERETAVQISVQDTGIGIAEKDLPRLFERFYRVDKARSRHSGGTGLGLAIVKHLVESHNGKITVESEEGRGSIFTIELPIEQKNPVP